MPIQILQYVNGIDTAHKVQIFHHFKIWLIFLSWRQSAMNATLEWGSWHLNTIYYFFWRLKSVVENESRLADVYRSFENYSLGRQRYSNVHSMKSALIWTSTPSSVLDTHIKLWNTNPEGHRCRQKHSIDWKGGKFFFVVPNLWMQFAKKLFQRKISRMSYSFKICC